MALKPDMSATLIPPTKTFGARPPIIPPTLTTFDGMGDDNRQPRHRVIADSVERLLQSVPSWPDEDLALLLRLLEQRTSMVEHELGLERLFDSLPCPLPPSIFGDAFPLDFVFDAKTEAETTYVGLLHSLDEAILRVRRKIGLLKDLLPSSEG
jgi:hypothetical protein